MDPINPHSEHSSLREIILEHSFLGALGRELWKRRCFDAEILRAEVDAAGYDIVVSVGSVTRHIQIKSEISGGHASVLPISERLSGKHSGCVIVIFVDRDTLEAQGYAFFGAEPGAPLPDVSDEKRAKHTKGDAQGKKGERKHHRNLKLSRCQRVADIEGLTDLLFGNVSDVH